METTRVQVAAPTGDIEIEMVLVPAGPFIMGSAGGEEVGDVVEPEPLVVEGLFEIGGTLPRRIPAAPVAPSAAPLPLRMRESPQRRVTLRAYWIGLTPVTMEQYGVYCAATGAAMPVTVSCRRRQASFVPAHSVSWAEAAEFCRWLSSLTGEGYRLPTEAEWEKAARGTDGRTYPWGEAAPTPWRATFGGTTPCPVRVGSCPEGRSPYGCLDMAGNVWEWCADWFSPDYYAYAPDEDPPGPPSGISRVVRGGAFDSGPNELRCAARFYDRPEGTPFFTCGFRVAKDA